MRAEESKQGLLRLSGRSCRVLEGFRCSSELNLSKSSEESKSEREIRFAMILRIPRLEMDERAECSTAIDRMKQLRRRKISRENRERFDEQEGRDGKIRYVDCYKSAGGTSKS